VGRKGRVRDGRTKGKTEKRDKQRRAEWEEGERDGEEARSETTGET